MTDKPSDNSYKKNTSPGKPASNKPSDCPICFESLALEKNAMICGHWVHLECAKKQTRDECPLCRTVLNLKPFVQPVIRTPHIDDMETSSEADQSECSEMQYEDHCEPWRKNGYNHKEEDIENYDEENPDGDSVYYD